MEISSNNPVGNKVEELAPAPKVSEIKRDKEEAPQQGTPQAEENPDYRISLSDESRQAVAERTAPPAANPSSEKAEITEEEAVRLAQQTSEQLSQTNAAISNQAIQKAVDLFT